MNETLNRHERRALKSSRVYRWEQIYERVGYSRQHIDRLERDDLFPRRFKLSPNGGRNGAVGWDADEVDAYLAARVASRCDRGAR